MSLTADEIRYILNLIAATLPGGFGYSSDPEVGKLQAKLSMLLEAKMRVAAIQISSHRFVPGWHGLQDRCDYNGCSWTVEHHVADRTTPEVNPDAVH